MDQTALSEPMYLVQRTNSTLANYVPGSGVHGKVAVSCLPSRASEVHGKTQWVMRGFRAIPSSRLGDVKALYLHMTVVQPLTFADILILLSRDELPELKSFLLDKNSLKVLASTLCLFQLGRHLRSALPR
jgi:hypothetical protein